MSTFESVLITGANAGLGKDTARLVALKPEVQKVYLAGRNPAKLEAAKAELEAATKRSIFDIVIVDTTDLASVRAAVAALPAIDAVVMNAGGAGGKTPFAKTDDGVTYSFAVNVLGHALLLETLLAESKLRKTAVFVSSEAARGIPAMRIPRPALNEHSVAEFESIADGSFFTKQDAMEHYGYVKYVGTLWMSALAREHRDIRFVSVSPGATTGTKATDNAPKLLGAFYKFVAFPMMKVFGMAHGLEAGSQRYVDVLTDDRYASGHFYASPGTKTSGKLVDQADLFADFADPAIQDTAATALRGLLAPQHQQAASA